MANNPHSQTLPALAILVVLTAGCGNDHITDCEGGLLITVSVEPQLLAQADELYVRLTAGTVSKDNTWPASELGSSGTGTAVIHFPDITESTEVIGYAELLSDTTVVAAAMASAEIEPADTGCFPLALSLGKPDVDAGADVIDAAVDLPDADPDAPDAGPGAPDAGGLIDSGTPDASPLPTDATPKDAFPTPTDSGGVVAMDGAV